MSAGVRSCGARGQKSWTLYSRRLGWSECCRSRLGGFHHQLPRFHQRFWTGCPRQELGDRQHHTVAQGQQGEAPQPVCAGSATPAASGDQQQRGEQQARTAGDSAGRQSRRRRTRCLPSERGESAALQEGHHRQQQRSEAEHSLLAWLRPAKRRSLRALPSLKVSKGSLPDRAVNLGRALSKQPQGPAAARP